jgi:hypothetical protein
MFQSNKIVLALLLTVPAFASPAQADLFYADSPSESVALQPLEIMEPPPPITIVPPPPILVEPPPPIDQKMAFVNVANYVTTVMALGNFVSPTKIPSSYFMLAYTIINWPQRYSSSATILPPPVNPVSVQPTPLTLPQMSFTKTDKFDFPDATFGDFALSNNTDSLDPKIAQPNLTEIGMPHLTVVQIDDAHAMAGANLLATQINMPLGWESIGGFDPFDKIFFYPKGARPDDGGLPLPYIALKVLDSNGLGVSEYADVMQAVDDLYTGYEAENPNYKDRLKISDPDNKTFIFEARDIKHVTTGEPLGTLDIYMQDPTPGSTLWLDLQLSVSEDDYEKYKGLVGLMYQDLQVEWDTLANIIVATR